MKNEKQPKPENNLQFTGKQMRYDKEANKQIKVAREVPEFIIDGREKIALPANLDKGGYVEPANAEIAKTLFPEDFKTPVKK